MKGRTLSAYGKPQAAGVPPFTQAHKEPQAMKTYVTDKPLAAAGLTSYRLRLPHGFVMIGARDHADAMREAARSVDSPNRADLEIWNGSTYVPAAQ